MLQIKIPQGFKEYLSWENQLKEWCVAHKIEIDQGAEAPFLIEGDKIIVGAESIGRFLEEYKLFLNDWYDCRCDKWMDDEESSPAK